MIQFQKAVKYESKGRVAIIGPSGSGKSFTGLVLARVLAGQNGRIAAIDTEHGSLSKYADLFDFDVLNLDSYSPANFLAALHAAEKAGYVVFLTDSLSHFWMGKDGALEFVDMASKRSSSRDGMAGWKEFRPHEREMVDAMIASSMHIICTMRTKTAYEEQTNERTGKKQRVKIGLAPVQREGLEYEFDLVGLMDEDNNFIVDKTRSPEYTGRAIAKPKADDFEPFRAWLAGAPAPPRPAEAEPPAAKQQTADSKRPVFHIEGNRILFSPLTVQERTSKQQNQFLVVKMPEKIGRNQLLFCFHLSLFEALKGSRGKTLQVEFEPDTDGKNLMITDVLAVGEQGYRDGKPYTEQAAAGARDDLVITDEDITF